MFDPAIDLAHTDVRMPTLPNRSFSRIVAQETLIRSVSRSMFQARGIIMRQVALLIALVIGGASLTAPAMAQVHHYHHHHHCRHGHRCHYRHH